MSSEGFVRDVCHNGMASDRCRRRPPAAAAGHYRPGSNVNDFLILMTHKRHVKDLGRRYLILSALFARRRLHDNFYYARPASYRVFQLINAKNS